MIDAYREFETNRLEKLRQKVEKRVYSNWSKLIRLALAKEYVKREYGGNEASASASTSSSTSSSIKKEEGNDDEIDDVQTIEENPTKIKIKKEDQESEDDDESEEDDEDLISISSDSDSDQNEKRKRLKKKKKGKQPIKKTKESSKHTSSSIPSSSISEEGWEEL